MAKSFDELVLRSASKKAKSRGKALAQKYFAEMLLSELRQVHGMTQKDLAAALRIKQPSLSKLESQGDMQISTLQKIVEALGGRLIIKAEFCEGAAELMQFDRKKSPVKKRRALAPH